jgi:DNA-binding MarR family transcriptional regulator
MIVVDSDTEEQPTLGFLLVRLGEAVDRRFVAALASLELRPRDLRALVLIDRHPGSTQRALARRMPSDPGNLVALLDRLELQGRVARRSDPDDRRRRTLELTPDGEALLERAIAATAEAEREVLAPLKDRERAALEAIALRLWRAT